MPIVPFEAPNAKVPQQQMSQVDDTALAMAEAMQIGERKEQQFQHVVASEKPVMLRHIGRGDIASNPAELYNAYRSDGHDAAEARDLTIDSLWMGNPEAFESREDVIKHLSNVPMS